MRTLKQYLEKLADMRKNIYIHGELIGRYDPMVVQRSGAVQLTFEKTEDPEFQDLVTTTSHITGETINRFTTFTGPLKICSRNRK